MARIVRHQGHDKYKTRINHLFELYADDSNTETQADNAKYLAVLVSGYLEQAIKEILLQYATLISAPPVSNYIKETWPTSKNMNAANIKSILEQFNKKWADEFSDWLEVTNNKETNGDRKKRRNRVIKEDRKGDINLLVSWRNYIAHGQESKTTGVTLVSVKEKFVTVRNLV